MSPDIDKNTTSNQEPPLQVQVFTSQEAKNAVQTSGPYMIVPGATVASVPEGTPPEKVPVAKPPEPAPVINKENMVEVNLANGGNQFVKKTDFDSITSPALKETIKQGGLDAFNEKAWDTFNEQSQVGAKFAYNTLKASGAITEDDALNLDKAVKAGITDKRIFNKAGYNISDGDIQESKSKLAPETKPKNTESVSYTATQRGTFGLLPLGESKTPKPTIINSGEDIINYLVANKNSKTAKDYIVANYRDPDGHELNIEQFANQATDIIKTKEKMDKGMSLAEVWSLGNAIEDSGVKIPRKSAPNVIGEYATKDVMATFNKLSPDAQNQVIAAYNGDKYKGNLFSEFVTSANRKISSLPEPVQYAKTGSEIALAFLVPPLGMGLLTAEQLAPTVAKASVGEKIGAMEIATDAAMVTLTALTHMPSGTVNSAIGSKIIRGLEGASLGVFGTNLAVNYNEMSIPDRVINIGMLAIPAIGLSGALKSRFMGRDITDTPNDPARIAKNQAKVLDTIIEANKDFINNQVIKDPVKAKEAETAYNEMAARTEEYARTSLEYKQAQQAISDIGLAKNQAEMKTLEALKDKSAELDKQLNNLSGKFEKSIRDYNSIVLSDAKFSDPSEIKAINDMPGNVRMDIDSITTQIVSPRNATSIAKDVAKAQKQLNKMEFNLSEALKMKGFETISPEPSIVGKIRKTYFGKEKAEIEINQSEIPDQITSTIRQLEALRNELKVLDREARMNYLGSGETARIENNKVITKIDNLSKRLTDANEKLAEYRKSAIDYPTYRKGEMIGESKVLKAQRDIWESVQKVTEPVHGRESYSSVIEAIDQASETLSKLMKESGVSAAKADKVFVDIVNAIRKQDPKALKASVKLLQIEASKLPEPLQLKAGQEIKLLTSETDRIMSEFMRGGSKQEAKSPKRDIFKSTDTDFISSRADLIRQEAERVVSQRLEKLTDKLPEHILKRSQNDIMDYLRDRYDADYFDSQYEGKYKNLDDFLDIEKTEAEIRAESRKQADIENRKRDIQLNEMEKKLAENFMHNVSKPELKKELANRTKIMERQIKEKKLALEERIKSREIPIDDISTTTDAPVSPEKSPAKTEKEEKSPARTEKERQSERRAETQVKRAEEKLKDTGMSSFPGLSKYPKISIRTNEGRKYEANAEELGRMTQAQFQRLYGNKVQIVDAYSPNNQPINITRLQGRSQTSGAEWISPNEAIKQAQQIQSQSQEQTIIEPSTKTVTRTQEQTQTQIKPTPQAKPQTKVTPIAKLETRTLVKPEPKIKGKEEVITKTDIFNPGEPIETKPPILVTSKGGAGSKWTPEEIKSAIAWKDGVVVHALKAPYRRGVDERSFNMRHLPEGLQVLETYKGAGSQQASARVAGKLPKKLTVDIGNQNLTITKQSGNRVRMKFQRDLRGTAEMLTVKRIKRGVAGSGPRNLSSKKGRIYHTKTSGGTIISRSPIRGY